jgi:hypothetical protein
LRKEGTINWHISLGAKTRPSYEFCSIAFIILLKEEKNLLYVAKGSVVKSGQRNYWDRIILYLISHNIGFSAENIICKGNLIFQTNTV